MTRLTTVLAVLAVLVLVVLAACGGQGGKDQDSAGGETPVTGSPGDATGGARSGRGAVQGVVRNAGGAVVPGVMVVPVALDEPAPAIPDLAVMTDDQGSYSWDLAPGRYQVQALREGALLGSVDVRVGAGETVNGDIPLGG